MEKLEKILYGMVVLCICLLPIAYGGLEQWFGDPPELESPQSLAVFTSPKFDNIKISPRKFEVQADQVMMTSVLQLDSRKERFFGNREKEVRRMLSSMNGGGEESEAAVQAGLQFLAKVQNLDGSWSSKLNPLASTGLALSCFLGAGSHHLDGEHQHIVERGISYLLNNIGGDGTPSREGVFGAATSCAALCEAYAMTGDANCKSAADRLLAYLSSAQGPMGGWGASPLGSGANRLQSRHETHVSAWVAMAFASAKNSGMRFDENVVRRYQEFTLRILDAKGQVPAILQNDQTEGHHERLTALTLAARMMNGENLKSDRIDDMMSRVNSKLPSSFLPRWTTKGKAMDNELWYSATQASFIAGGKYFDKWNKMLMPLLLEHQQKEGDSQGGWKDEYFASSEYGEVFATCLNILTLETYYRFAF